MTAISLGPLPWSDEILEQAYWQGFVTAYEAIREHPGYELHKRQQSLNSALRLFRKWCSRFHEDLDRFHVEAHEGRITDMKRAQELKQFEVSFQEALYVIASTAMTLVDQSRRIKKYVEPISYKEQIEIFANDPAHRFIQELRNDFAHSSLHQPNWQLSVKEDGTRSTEMILFLHQFSWSAKQNLLARQYLQDRPEGIPISALIMEYQAKVVAFHEWLHQAIVEKAGGRIADYLRCECRLKAIGAHSMWRVLLSQVVIPNKKDPFQYLDRYLTPEQITEINQLPQRSEQQIDRIIEMVDEYGACDEELKHVVYQAFAVGIPQKITRQSYT